MLQLLEVVIILNNFLTLAFQKILVFIQNEFAFSEGSHHFAEKFLNMFRDRFMLVVTLELCYKRFGGDSQYNSREQRIRVDLVDLNKLLAVFGLGHHRNEFAGWFIIFVESFEDDFDFVVKKRRFRFVG